MRDVAATLQLMMLYKLSQKIRARYLKIHLYTLCWNEVRMLPYFFRHYDHLIDRYFIDDNGSTDGSIEMLSAHPKVTLGHFEVEGDSFVDAARIHYNQCWKQSRGQADWVIVCNIDEHIYHRNLRGYLADCKRQGTSLIIPAGYNMISDTFPRTDEPLSRTIKYGVRDLFWDKPQLFNPNKIKEINFAPGRHTAAPTGEFLTPEAQDVKMLHFKYLGIEYLIRRHSELRNGLTRRDIEEDWGNQYLWDEERNTEEYQRLKSQAQLVL